MLVTKPLIIFGTGRSGTTIFYQMLSEHPHVAWLSSLCERYPDKPFLNRYLMRALDLPVVGNFLRTQIHPSEAYGFWAFYAKGFRSPCRDLVAEDVTAKMKRDLRQAMSEMLTPRRHRLLLKITGWPRLGFLAEVFEDAKFIHVVRDGRAVANSFLNVDFWQGWGGPQKWRWGPLPSHYREVWERYGRSFIVLAALQWKLLMDAAEAAIERVGAERVLEVRYEALCVDPIAVFRKVAAFGELEWRADFEARLRKYRLENMNAKYTQELTLQQQRDLNAVLADYLKKFGYE